MDRPVRPAIGMRRSDYDVTDKVQTTDPIKVGKEVARLFEKLFDGAAAPALRQGFSDLDDLYQGRHPEYLPCDTEYHDIQHVLDVTLAMARLMDGYERSRRNGSPTLGREGYIFGVVLALFHDFGYLRRRGDRRHRYGAEYTLTHVSRSAAYLRKYLPSVKSQSFDAESANLVHFTGYERPVESIRVTSELQHRIGCMLGTADIIAQMADRCYLEKCRDRLYPEFVLGGLTRRKMPDGRPQTMFRSGDDLVHKTPGFYRNAVARLDDKLDHAYTYAASHFGGQNLYMEEVEKNVRYAERISRDSKFDMLRRMPPSTLLPTVEPYPEDLVIR